MIELLSERRVCEITSLSRTTLWRLRHRGEFPNPISLTAGRKVYSSDAIDAWIKERVEGGSDA